MAKTSRGNKSPTSGSKLNDENAPLVVAEGSKDCSEVKASKKATDDIAQGKKSKRARKAPTSLAGHVLQPLVKRSRPTRNNPTTAVNLGLLKSGKADAFNEWLALKDADAQKGYDGAQLGRTFFTTLATPTNSGNTLWL